MDLFGFWSGVAATGIWLLFTKAIWWAIDTGSRIAVLEGQVERLEERLSASKEARPH